MIQNFYVPPLFYRDDEGGDIFLARVPDRLFKDINVDKLEGILINPDQVFPSFDPAALTLCPNTTTFDVFIKRPSLLQYDPRDNMVKATLLQEAQVCEILKKFRHVNIAEYLGCKVENSRITGLCFKRYERTLFDRMKETRGSFDCRLCIESI